MHLHLTHDSDSPIRVRRVPKGSRKTGKIAFEDIRKVLMSLEAEASQTILEKKAAAKAMTPDVGDTSVNGMVNRKRSWMTVGSWRLLLAVSLPIYTGYRSSDCHTIMWDQLLFINADGDVEVRKTILTKERKTKKRREVPINDDLAGYIIKAYQELKPRFLDTYVFRPKHEPSSKHTHISRIAYWKMLTGSFSRFEVYDRDGYVSAHCLRKSYATEVFNRLGGDHYALLQLQKMLNHHKIEDTIRYLDVRLEEAEMVHEKLSFRGPGARPVSRSNTVSRIY